MRYWYRYNPDFYEYEENPETYEAAVRKLLKAITGASWKVGHPPPEAWQASYVSSHPEWTAIWLVSKALGKSPEELLLDIRPGRRRLRDIDELSILYEYMKDHLAAKGTIKSRDLSDLAQKLGLTTLSGPGTTEAKDRSYLLKQLVLDGYATQHMGRFKGSSIYRPTAKLLDEFKKALQPALPPIPDVPAPPPVLQPPEAAPTLPPSIISEEEMPISLPISDPEIDAPSVTTPAVIGGVVSRELPRRATRRILIVGGQAGSCPDGTPSLRAIKAKECSWLDDNFQWRVLPSYRTDQFRAQNIPHDVDLVIIFSKFMGHSQVNLISEHCRERNIPYINNFKGAQLGSLQMAAEQAKTHGPKWFHEAYSAFASAKRTLTRSKKVKKKKGGRRKPNPIRHRKRRRYSSGNARL